MDLFVMRVEYLIMLAESLEGEKMALLEQFGLRYLKGELPKWFYAVFLSSQAVPLYKTIDGSALRPIGIKHQLLQSFHKEVVKQNKAEFIAYLEPEQLAMSEAMYLHCLNNARGKS